MKAPCFAVLLCAFVQVQSLTPYVYSERSHYGLFSSSTTPLGEGTIFVQFDAPFDTRDCSLGAPCFVIASDTNDVTVTTGIVTMDVANQRVSFTPQVVVGNNFAGEATISIAVPSGAFTSQSSSASFSSSSEYKVYAGGKLNRSGVVFFTNPETQTAGAVIIFNRATYNLASGEHAGQPFQLTVNGAATPRSYKYEHVLYPISATGQTDDEWVYATAVMHKDVVCLEAVHTDDQEVIRDVFGNTLKGSDFATSCETVELSCGSFSEWSKCPYLCTPAEADIPFNVQTRSRDSINGLTCNSAIETRQCETTGITCVIYIEASETGKECTNNPNSGTCNTSVVTTSGCKCSADCLETGDCCQSYYKECVTDAADNPDYFYKYSTCWTPKSCGQAGGPGCDTQLNDLSGSCQIGNTDDSRNYRYRCYCKFATPDFMCSSIPTISGPVDLCCSGGLNYGSSCLI